MLEEYTTVKCVLLVSLWKLKYIDYLHYSMVFYLVFTVRPYIFFTEQYATINVLFKTTPTFSHVYQSEWYHGSHCVHSL